MIRINCSSRLVLRNSRLKRRHSADPFLEVLTVAGGYVPGVVLTHTGGAVLAGRVQVALVNVHLALGTGEAGLTLAGVLVHPIDTLGPVLAGVRLALVNVHLTLTA